MHCGSCNRIGEEAATDLEAEGIDGGGNGVF